MRIALVTMSAPSDASPFSGQYNLHQGRALKDLGVDVHIVVPALWFPRLAAAAHAGIRRLLSVPRTWTRDGVPCTLVRAPMLHPNLLRERLALRAPGLVGASVKAALARPLERVLRSLKPDVLLVHDAIVLGQTAAAIAPRLNARLAFIEHEGIDWPPTAPIARAYAKISRSAAAVFAVAPPSLDRLRSYGLSNVHLAPDGIHAATDAQLATPRPPELAPFRLILSAGSPIPAKGQAELIRAFAAAALDQPDTRLVLVGPLAPGCDDLIGTLNLRPHVLRPDRMPAAEFQQWLAWADLFALPSHRESFGMVFAEALAAGTPVICTDACGIAPLLRHGQHGWIVPVRDHAALTAALREALTTADLPAMGRAGQALVRGRFTWANSARAILDALTPQPSPGTTPPHGTPR